MSRSKRDILDTEKMLERLAGLLTNHLVGKITDCTQCRRDAEALRRISMTLHTWHELECGTDRGHIEREDTGLTYWRFPDGKKVRTADREAGAIKRLKKIMRRYPALTAYVQGDPRGCALYILKPGDVPRDGYRAAQNTHYNIGFYIRPDDEKSFSPAKVFKTQAEAWADFEREKADNYYSRGLAVYK